MTESIVNVFLKPSPEIEELMTDLDVSWREILEREDIHVEESRQADPIASTQSRAKEPVTILLASAGLVMALAPALSRVLSEVFRRPIKVLEKVLVPVEDSEGNVLRNSDGTPILQWVDRARLLEPRDSTHASATTLKGPLSLELKIEESRS